MTRDTAILAVAALLLDSLLGDPVFPLHPVRLMGKLNTAVEKFLKTVISGEKTAGWIGLAIGIFVPALCYAVLYRVAAPIPAAQVLISVVTIYFSIALKDLARHGLAVKKALGRKDLKDAGTLVSYLVTRDTGQMGMEEITKCALESISENGSDSVIAPLFWTLLFGAPGALVYRAVNTLDAMWGYKTAQYVHFGKPAALLDDWINFIPARITGILYCLCAPFAGGSSSGAWRIMKRDHRNVFSPNAGYPEAAMAGALGVSIGGPGTYFGKRIQKKPMGDPVKPVHPDLISRSLRILYVSTLLFLVLSETAVLLLKGMVTPVQ